MQFQIRKGLNIPVAGEPEQTVDQGATVGSVALLAEDYIAAELSPLVRVGERVRLGQALCKDRFNPEIRFASPGAGVVSAVRRNERDELKSIVVSLSGEEEERLPSFSGRELAKLDRQSVTETLCTSGFWTALRTRPFGRIPRPADTPDAIFVTAIDTNPLAADPGVVINAQPEAFRDGLSVISRLTEGRAYLCSGIATTLPSLDSDLITLARFSGPHPAGLVGTHIALLEPLAPGRSVWHVGYQDVIAIGKLFRSGHAWVERIIALGGPMVGKPRLLRTRLGANTHDLTRGELEDGDCRIISGSVLSGRTASGPAGHLGRYHLQLSALADERTSTRNRERRRTSYSFYRPARPAKSRRARTTYLHGRLRAMLPFPSFDRVMPLDILVSPLLRALLVGDCETAEALGCCELEEEDLSLCTFLCPSKNEYGQFLRSVLTEIEARESS